MNIRVRHLILCAVSGAAALAAAPAPAAVSQTPLIVTHAVRPRVLLAMSNDHAFYYKAYTDWNDLDGDGRTDGTYTPGFLYYGYFDPVKCYDYANGRFEPRGVTADGYCDTVAGDWSGNFMNWATMSRMDIVRKVLYGGYRSTDTAAETVLERSYLPSDAHSFAKFYDGADIARLTPFNETAITLCNSTYRGSGLSQDVGDPTHSDYTPPRISIARGDFRYWASNERWQCTWSDEKTDASSGSNNTGSETSDPNPTADGLGLKNYTARVKVCVPDLLGSESCKGYPAGAFKPVGLLHEYGEDGNILFGLITGSYQKNKSGGVLRKNIGSFTDEVDPDTGVFTGATGIVDTLNRFRIARYDYGDGTYIGTGAGRDNCNYRLASFNDGQCSNWGNPLSEVYLEALRYLAGLSPTSAFAADDTGYIPGLRTTAWDDPLDTDTWCAHCDIIVINASDSSYDDDSVDTSGLSGSPNAVSLTNALGSAEGIAGHDWFVGSTAADQDQLCTAKTVSGLGDVRGACPGAPRLEGTYLIAGLAHWAHTNDIRALTGDQRVTTRAVALLPGVPNLRIPVPGSERWVTILPACRNQDLRPSSPPEGNCAIVDFKIVAQDLAAGTGTVYVNWENGEQGGDYDQDMKGTLSYVINPGANTITVTTDVNGYSGGDARMGFGYVIGGTDQDGFHAHSGAGGSGFSYTHPVSGVQECHNCQLNDAATSATYTLGDSGARLLQQPLWYTAKYGGFNDTDGDNLPDRNEEWDANGDGEPDGYFLANNPADLGSSLARFLDIIATTSSSAAVATNSFDLSAETHLFQARYDTSNWTGDLLAFPIGLDGSIGEEVWSARETVESQSANGDRRILTTNEASRTGVPFRWGDSDGDNTDGISDAQKLDLRRLCPGCSPSDESLGMNRLAYLRGDLRQEISGGGDMRDRDYVLADIVSSEPSYVGQRPEAGYSDDIEPAASYRAFADTTERAAMVYAGANDGMLHAFDAESGREVFAYVPRPVYPKLAELTANGYQGAHRFYVDGGIVARDVYSTATGWRTVLVAGLGAGGAGMFALDVTDPTAFASDEASGMQKVLWDIAGGDPGFEDLGYTFSKPMLVRLPDDNLGGAWAAVFGNGYHDAQDDGRGKAVLYLVDAFDGTLLDTVVADNGPANGLSSVAPIDFNGDGRIDYIYAGDIKGNLWRFEPDGGEGWKVSFAGEPLFNPGGTYTDADVTVKTPQSPICPEDCNGDPDDCPAGVSCTPQPDLVETVTVRTWSDARPITSRPQVTRHPEGGVMVLFGTGSYYRDADRLPDPDTVHSFYGIWDRFRADSGIRREHLLEHRVLAQGTVGDYEVRVSSYDEIVWHDVGRHGTELPQGTPPATHLGWYIDLLGADIDGAPVAEGEIQVTDSQLRYGRVIFTTAIPSDVSCEFGGDGWLVELTALDGNPPELVLFDLNGDGLFTLADTLETTGDDGEPLYLKPTFKKSTVGILQRPALIEAGSNLWKYGSGAREAGIERTLNPGDPSGGRRSWLQLN